MPPVADSSDTWEQAISDALDQNAAAGRKPDSVRSLARVLADQSGGSPTEDSWRRTVGRIIAGRRPTEEKAIRLARALGVPRTRLPETGRETLASAVARLRELEARMGDVEKIQDEALERLTGLLGEVADVSRQVADLRLRIEQAGGSDAETGPSQ